MAELTDLQRDEIIAALGKRRKIEAIKRYREVTGQGLKESKEFVDALQVRLHEEHPERFPAPLRIGCGAVLIACVCGTGIMAAWLTL